MTKIIDADTNSSSWQRRAVERIAALTTVAQLEEALEDPFLKALRAWRREVQGRDSAGTKLELIEALLVQHGADLLRNCKELRAIIGTATGSGAPGAFHSGKEAAIRFVAKAGLPKELAGSPAPQHPHPVTIVSGPQRQRGLEDYQVEAKKEIGEALCNGSAVICSLPTGGGKTRVAIEAIVEMLCREIDGFAQRRRRVMWTAHTRELCEQAVETFSRVWGVLATDKYLLLGNTADARDDFQTRFREAMQDRWDAAVIVTTPIVGAQLLSAGGLDGEAPLAVRALFIDEAHRAAAPTYRKLIDSARAAASPDSVPIIGLTATPFRSIAPGQAPDAATLALRNIFDDGLILPEILLPDPKRRLIERGCLARPTYEAIQGTRLHPPQLADQGEEWIDNALGKAAGKDLRRRRRVFGALCRVLQANPKARVLYFGPTVTDAEVISFLLLKEGFGSAVVSAKTHVPVRREVIQQFKKGRYQVLCNHGVLTTGFDDPQITHVVVARPTVSLVLYEQMVGRGLRGPLFGGTEECHILSVEDTFDGGGLAKVWMDFIESWTPHVSVRR